MTTPAVPHRTGPLRPGTGAVVTGVGQAPLQATATFAAPAGGGFSLALGGDGPGGGFWTLVFTAAGVARGSWPVPGRHALGRHGAGLLGQYVVVRAATVEVVCVSEAGVLVVEAAGEERIAGHFRLEGPARRGGVAPGGAMALWGTFDAVRAVAPARPAVA